MIPVDGLGPSAVVFGARPGPGTVVAGGLPRRMVDATFWQAGFLSFAQRATTRLCVVYVDAAPMPLEIMALRTGFGFAGPAPPRAPFIRLVSRRVGVLTKRWPLGKPPP